MASGFSCTVWTEKPEAVNSDIVVLGIVDYCHVSRPLTTIFGHSYKYHCKSQRARVLGNRLSAYDLGSGFFTPLESQSVSRAYFPIGG